MNLEELQRNWELFGTTDPLWAINTEPGKKRNQWDKDEFFETGKQEVASVFEHLESRGINIPTGKALDFGCGVGRLTQALCSYFSEVIGIDISTSMITRATGYNRCPDKCKYVLNARPDLSVFPDDQYDLVYSSITLQHMEPEYARSYLREFVRVLRPDGLLVFQIPDSPDYRHPGNILRKVVPGTMLTAFRNLRYGKNRPRMEMYSVSRAEVVQLLEESGARVLDIDQDNSARHWRSYRYCATKRLPGYQA